MSSRTWNMPTPFHDWLVQNVVHEHPALTGLREETAAHVDQAQMQISPEQGRLMMWLVQTLGVRRALEVGTYTGYSALAVALALPDDGEILCCDVSERWTSIGRRHWDQAGVGHRITLRLAPAIETLQALLDDGQAGTWDFAFVDADKENYGTYYEQVLRLLRPGGVLAVDNTIWGGRVADPQEQGASTQAIRDLVIRAAADPRVTTSLVPIGDGLLLVTRRA